MTNKRSKKKDQPGKAKETTEDNEPIEGLKSSDSESSGSAVQATAVSDTSMLLAFLQEMQAERRKEDERRQQEQRKREDDLRKEEERRQLEKREREEDQRKEEERQ